MPFIALQKTIWYLEITLTKEQKNFYGENSKALLKDIKDNLKKMEQYNMFTYGKTIA